MKKLIIALIAIAGIFTADTVQAGDHYKTIAQKGDGANWVHADILVIPSGKCAEQVALFSNNHSDNFYDWVFKILKDGVTYEAYERQSVSGIIAGPATIKLSTARSAMVVVTYRIFPNPPE